MVTFSVMLLDINNPNWINKLNRTLNKSKRIKTLYNSTKEPKRITELRKIEQGEEGFIEGILISSNIAERLIRYYDQDAKNSSYPWILQEFIIKYPLEDVVDVTNQGLFALSVVAYLSGTSNSIPTL